ncbi:MAG: hypothetical protein ACD_62C00065G0002 [uncultured bacterium]|nr:MAG: hypothetical protein ACD_62C00065G0002 [uncultured bacterium]
MTPGGLRHKVIKGGAYLAGRQLVGMLLSMVSMVIIFRYLGPKDFGLLSVTQGIWFFVGSVASLGLDVFLIREKESLREEEIRQIFTLIVLVFLFAYLTIWILSPFISIWLGNVILEPLLKLAGVVYLLKQIGLVSQALLDRSLEFRKVSLVELASQIIYYVGAIPLVIAGWTYWGVMAGLIISTGFMTLYLIRLHSIHPVVCFHMPFVKRALKYGLGYQFAVWTWQIRDFAVPVVIAKIAGLEAAGIVSATNQLINRVSFLRGVVWRISIAAFAKIYDDIERMLRAIQKGMVYQALLLGVMFVGVAMVLPWVHLILGPKWIAVAGVYPFLATGILMNAVFSLQCSALFAKGFNHNVNKFHIANITILLAASFFIIPRLGLWGYCIAELMALLSYVVLHNEVIRNLGKPTYGIVFIVLATVTTALFVATWFPYGNWVVSGGLVMFASMARIRKEFNSVYRELRAELAKE